MLTTRRTAGFTLIEVMIGLVVLGLVMGSALTVFRSQSRNFKIGGERLEMSQNLRFAVGTIDRVIRTTGAGATAVQPMFVYGDSNTVAVNADYTDSINSGNAVYVNPDAPSGSFTALPVANAYTLPGTAFVYPSTTYNDVNGTPGPAETIVFYFQLDPTTADPLDYALWQKVNSLPAEVVARNIYHYPSRAFFEYYVHPRTLPVPPATRDSLVLSTLVAGMVPIRHSITLHGSAGDTAGSTSAVADSVKALRVNVRVTNGLLAADQRFRDVSTTIPMPNNGLIPLRTCGSVPLFSSAIGVAPTTVAVVNSVPVGDTITWSPAFDETGGERDVQQYNIYMKPVLAPAWGPPVLTQRATGGPYQVFLSSGITAGALYNFAVAASDCTPNESPLLTTAPFTAN
ncbi:MAG: prepilin-type N-terminal cleavage/methylation domain-containing protein [Gemmatimonadota bacterium]